MELGVVEQVDPVDDVEDHEEDGEHRDPVSLDLEEDLLVPIFSLEDSLLFLVFDVFGRGRAGGLDERVVGRLVVRRRRVDAANVDERRRHAGHRQHLVLKQAVKQTVFQKFLTLRSSWCRQ